MERRLILTIGLSLLVLLAWSNLVSKPYHLENKEVTIKIPPPAATQVKSIKEEVLLPPLKYENDKFEIYFQERDAVITQAVFKGYKNHTLFLYRGFSLEEEPLVFRKEAETKNQLVFSSADPNKRVTKKFSFHNSSYSIELSVEIENKSSSAIEISLPLILGELDFSPQNIQARYQDVLVAQKEKTSHVSPKKDSEFKDILFLGLRDQYFCAIIEPEPLNNYPAFIRRLNSQRSDIGFKLTGISISPGQVWEQKFLIYLGPQDLTTINQIRNNWSAIIYYGTFDFISQILLQLLQFFYKLVNNWGWAIIILSVVIYLLLFPLTLKQMRSMKEMQNLQPQIEELRNAYKNNPQRLNKEIMNLYRQHKVNPLGGCLPLILQMPIFFALYQALSRSVLLKGAKFLWIKDLSEPDRLFTLPFSLPILGNELNILPIVMAIGMFIQQKISMVNKATSSDEQQKIMMIMFPLLFGFIFYRMPAGLVLYWFINSAILTAYQLRIMKSK